MHNDDYEYYKELYHKENDRRQEVLNALNIPLAIITALGTAMFILTTTFSFSVHRLASGFFIFSMVSSLSLLLCATYFLSIAFVNFKDSYEYMGIPYAREVNEYRTTLQDHVAQHYADEPDPQGKADELYRDYLIRNLIEVTDHNTLANDQKHIAIFKAKRLLVLCAFSCLLALPWYMWGFFGKKDEIHKVEIVQPSHESARPATAAEATARAAASTAATATTKQNYTGGTGAAPSPAPAQARETITNHPPSNATRTENTTTAAPTAATATTKQADTTRPAATTAIKKKGRLVKQQKR